MVAKSHKPNGRNATAAKKKKQRGRLTKGDNSGRVVGWREGRKAPRPTTRAKRVILGPKQIDKLSEDE